ncbi:MAG: DUF4838 domain-containing protein [Phycisphaerae bacterium]|nr:DUF4838 domain-containing protein [Phycisphaerae bacterium]
MLNRKAAVVTLVVGVLLYAADYAQAAVTIVADGKADAVIVTPSKTSPAPWGRAAEEGAEILRDHLFQISGARLKVLKESELTDVKVANGRIKGKGRPRTFILVGGGKLASQLGITSEGLGPGGILIRTFANGLVMLGADDKTPSDPYGSRYAVTTFLEDELGCRYLWPGENGKVIPRRKTIAIEPLDLRFTPLFEQRNIRWRGYSSRIQEGLERLGFTKDDFLQARQKASSTRSQSGNWMGWHRMGGTLGLRTGDGTILPTKTWERFLKEHPKWFAMQRDGSRYFDASWERPRLCKSNAALAEAIAAEKIKDLDAQPGQRSISLMTQDGGGKAGFCMCPKCKALDPPEGRPTRIWTYNHKSGRTERFDYLSLTDRMACFYNAVAEKVAEKYPNVLFTGQAYSVYASPPLRHKLHPNMVIRLVHRTDHYASDEVRGLGMADWDAWSDAVGMIFWRPNSLLWGRFEGTTGVYAHKLAEDFKHIAKSKCVGTDFDSCIHHWATQGLNYYILAKLHWDADLNVDEAIDDYCRSGFADASGQIKRYLLRIEQLTDKTAARKGRDINSQNADVTEFYTPRVIAELRGLLSEADNAAKENAEVQHRIAFLRIGLDFTELQAEIYRLLRLSGQRQLEPAERTQATRLLDKKFLMMRNIFEENHYAINVAVMSWGEWGRFRRLGWNGPSTEKQAGSN